VGFLLKFSLYDIKNVRKERFLMKNLKKALAAVVALAVVSASSAALAASSVSIVAPEGESATVAASFADATNTLTASVTGAKAGEQSTFIILDKDANELALDADDILYIDQNDTGSFTGAINTSRVTGGLTAGSYTVKLGYYNSLGAFKVASGALTIGEASGVTGISFDQAGSATVGTGLDLTATVTGSGSYTQGYNIAIKDGTNACGATLVGNHLDAATAGTVTVVATATGASADGGAAKTAELVVTFALPANALTSVSVTADDSAPETGATVNLTASFVDPSASGVTLDWSATGGILTPSGSTATLTSSTEATITVTVTATTSYATKTATIVITFSDPVLPSTFTIKWGDINSDNLVSTLDALEIVYKGLGSPSTIPVKDTSEASIGSVVVGETIQNIKWGDINSDGLVSTLDALEIVYKGLGSPNTISVKDTNKVSIGSVVVGDSIDIPFAE
jgi:hypothetical protein